MHHPQRLLIASALMGLTTLVGCQSQQPLQSEPAPAAPAKTSVTPMAKAIELEAKSPYHRDGFYTTVRDGRLWVFEENSKDLATFLKHGDPVKQVTRIGVGPGGMTIRSSDASIINAYLAAKTGFFTKHEEGRLWVFRAGSPELASFLEKGEPAKQVTRIGVGPNGETVKSSDGSVIDAYLNAQ